MPDITPVIAALRRDWSLDFSRVWDVLVGLVDGGTVSDLVARSGLPRRDVEAVLEKIEEFVKTEGDRRHLPALTFEQLVSPGATQPAAGPQLVERMAGLAAGLPPSRWRLDHVPATPETMAGRALYLAEHYELDGASVLCLGDHDLTSLAVGSVAPGADLTVVDIDERILDHVSDSAGRLGFPVTPAWADLRLALPASLVGTADLVFTDPPYTIDGMRLFLVRALEALRPTGHERLAFCFGTGERHLVKALEVQALLGDLRLALEAMLPGFNRYAGAEAIGARSDLYICRPTKGARVGEVARPSRSKRRGDARIYTRGPSALEAPERGLPGAVVDVALGAAGEAPPVLVGDSWSEPGVSLPEFFARSAAWATAARPGPFPFPGTPVINAAPDFGSAALRTLLLIAPERAVLIAPRRDLLATGLLAGQPAGSESAPAGLLTAAYDLAVMPTGPGGDPAVVLATRQERAPADAAEAVLRHILLHPGAKIVNAWRDALTASARDAGTPMTKNEARARISVDALPSSLRRLRAWELPLSALQALTAEVARLTAE
jgi:N4-bis(aminopropyl)spermidine synthase